MMKVVKWTPKRLLIYFVVIWVTGIIIQVFVMPSLLPESDPGWIAFSLIAMTLSLVFIYYIKVYTAPKDYLKVRRTPEDYRKLLGNPKVYVGLLFITAGLGLGLGFFGIAFPIALLYTTLTGLPFPRQWGSLMIVIGPLIGLCVMAIIVKKKYPWFIDRMWLIELYAQEAGEEEEQEDTESIDQ